MTPFRFNGEAHALFGLLHAPEAALPGGTGILVCNPFGQEAVRSHRLFRVMAERLARQGHQVLRFDYHGTGDSAGDDGDGDLPSWQADILRAHDELIARSGCRRVVWMGARMGATLALLASRQAPRPPDALLIWEPLLDGVAYLAELARSHEQALRITYSILPRDIELRPHDEAMGFALTPRLRAQMMAIDHSALAGAAVRQQVMVASQADHAIADAPTGVRRLIFEHAFEWTSEEAIYSSPLVPPDALRMLVEQLGGLSGAQA